MERRIPARAAVVGIGEVPTGRFPDRDDIEAAVDVLKQVVALKPSDTLSAKLLKQLDAPQGTIGADAGTVADPSQAPASAATASSSTSPV